MTPRSLAGWPARLMAIGAAPGDDREARLRKAALVLSATTISVLAIAWVVVYLVLDRPVAAAIPFVYQVATMAGIADLAATRRYERFRASQVALMLVLPFLLAWVLGGFVSSSAVMIWAFAAPMGALVFDSRRTAVRVFGGFVILMLVSGLIDSWLVERIAPPPAAVITAFFVLDIVGVAAATFLVVLYFVGERSRALADLGAANRALQAEQATSERLLRSILPDPVAARLRDGEGRVADAYEAVTVLFIDVVGFTPLAARLTAGQLVDLLDGIFGRLDDLAERHGLETIKTVGDTYLAVAGLPDPRPALDGARAAAEMALEVVPVVRAVVGPDSPLRVRIGLHTGPVVAGVIGRRKLAYDLWGDAVNVASRMESQGLPDEVQVSAATHALLQDGYRFRPRGRVEVKGRGPMETYLLVGRLGTATEVTAALPGDA